MSDLDFEKQVLSNAIQKETNLDRCFTREIKEEFFSYPVTRRLFVIAKYYFEYSEAESRLLTSETLIALLNKAKATSVDMQKEILVLFEEIKNQPLHPDFNLLLDQFKEYYQTNASKALLDKAVDLIANKKLDEFLQYTTEQSKLIQRNIAITPVDSLSFGDKIDKYQATWIDKQLHPEKYKGVPTGFPTIDNKILGLKRGTVTLIIGAPKSGKSVLMVNFMANAYFAGKRVLYHANEGGEELIMDRFVSCCTGLPMTKISNSLLDQTDKEKMFRFLDTMRGKDLVNIHYAVSSMSNCLLLDTLCQRLQQTGPLDLLIVDYMGLMHPTQNIAEIEHQYQIMMQITQELKALAETRQVPILVLVHAAGAKWGKSQDKPFEMEDMGLSKEPAKHADMIWSWRITTPDELFKETHKGEGMLSIMGSRNSEEPTAKLLVDTNIMKVSEGLPVTISY